MIIKITAGSLAKKYSIQENINLKDGANIYDALAELAVPADEIGLTSVNGKAFPRDYILNDGDNLEIFPVIVDG